MDEQKNRSKIVICIILIGILFWGFYVIQEEFAKYGMYQLISYGVKAIWNFAPIHLDVPDHILVQAENMATSLAVLSMHLRAQMKDKK